jgi:hypothetical protein
MKEKSYIRRKVNVLQGEIKYKENKNPRKKLKSDKNKSPRKFH